MIFSSLPTCLLYAFCTCSLSQYSLHLSTVLTHSSHGLSTHQTYTSSSTPSTLRTPGPAHLVQLLQIVFEVVCLS